MNRPHGAFFRVCAAVALSLLGDALLYNALPTHTAEFGVLVWQVGILLGVNRMIRLITNEIAGRIVDRYGLKRPMTIALVLGGLTTASYTLPMGFWGLLAARALWGACWSVIRAEGLVVSLATARVGQRGKVLSVYHAVSRLGAGGGVLLGGLLIDLIGLRTTLLIFGLTTALGALVVPGSEPARTTATAPIADEPAPSEGRTARGFLLLSALCVIMAHAMVGALTGRLMVDRVGAGAIFGLGVASLTGVLLSLREAGNLLAGPAAGALGDRLGRGRILVIVSAAQAVAMGLLAVAKTPAFTIGLLAFYLFFGSAAYVTLLALAGDRAPSQGRALFMSRFTSFLDLGSAMGPMIGYVLYARYSALWISVLSVALLVATPIFFALSVRSAGYSPDRKS